MRDVAVSSTGYGSKQRVIVGLVILLAGVGALLYGLFGNVDNALPVVGLGALITLFAVTVLGRTVSLPLSRVISWPLARLARHHRRAGQRERQAEPEAHGGDGVGADDRRRPRRLHHDLRLVLQGVRRRHRERDVHRRRDRHRAGRLRLGWTRSRGGRPDRRSAGGRRGRRHPGGFAEIDGDAQDVLGIDNALFDLFDVGVVSGSPDDLDATSIAVHEDVADDKGLGIGDTVPVVFRSTGAQELTVRLVYSEQQPAGDWVFPMEAWEANNAEQYDFQVFVKAADGVGPPRRRPPSRTSPSTTRAPRCSTSRSTSRSRRASSTRSSG